MTQIDFWTNDYTSTSLPIHSYSSLSTPVQEYVSDNRYIHNYLLVALQRRLILFLSFFFQFAYHEASFFLIRLLQNFSSISLATDAQPLDSRPPAEWAEDKEGRKGREKVCPKTHLTMYVQVCVGFLSLHSTLFFLGGGWVVFIIINYLLIL